MQGVPDIQVTIECGFTLKHVRDMIRTYSQTHRIDKYSQHNSIKLLSVRLQAKWLWVRVQLQSLKSENNPVNTFNFTDLIFNLKIYNQYIIVSASAF